MYLENTDFISSNSFKFLMESIFSPCIVAIGVIPDIFVERINPGDIFLLCSDGLTNMVSEDNVSKVLSKSCDIEKKVSELVELAVENGGKDNITLVMLESDNGGEQ